MLNAHFNTSSNPATRGVYWYGEKAGEIVIPDGPEARRNMKWISAGTTAAKVFEGDRPGQLPHFLRFLSPEGWLANRLFGRNPQNIHYLSDGLRYLSNITILDGERHLMDGVGIDAHEAHLADYTDANGQFKGRYSGPVAPSLDTPMEDQIGALWKSATMPKFSGAQVKIPMSLLRDGVLTVANPTPFTHILKMPGKGHFASVGAVEWMALELSDAAGLDTAKHALVDLPSGMAPGVAVERFDIPEKGDEHTRLLIADLCTIGGLDPHTFRKDTSEKKCIDLVDKASSAPKQDTAALFKRLAFAYLISDYDAHLKNLSMLKTVDMRDPDRMQSRFSPTYDAVVTTVFMPQTRRLCVPINGRYDNISLDQLAQFGKKCGLDKGEAAGIIQAMAASIARRAVEIASNPPPAIAKNAECIFAVRHAATEVVDRARSLGVDTPAWDPVRPDAERIARIDAYFRKEDGDNRPLRYSTKPP